MKKVILLLDKLSILEVLMLNILDRFKDFSSNTAIIYDKQSYTYDDLYKKITLYIEKFSKIPQNSRVIIRDDYSFESIAIFISLMICKHIVIPIVSEQELKQKSQECKANLIIDKNNDYKIETTDYQHENTQLPNQSSGLILFSSGSTGKPKAMLHDLNKLISQIAHKKPKRLNTLLFLMFDHIGGINTLLNILLTGQTAIVPTNRKDILHIASLIEQYKISVLPASPTFLNLMLLSKAYQTHDLSSLKIITYGTESMPQTLLSNLQKVFPKTKFLQTFGTSEVGIMQTVSEKSGSLFMKISDPNIEYKIVNNELWIKSKTQTLGYLNASMESFEDGYFKTGDLVETKQINDEEYIKIIGRSKELINVGGEKVLPQEIEGIILQIEGILDCTVYGEKNLITGQSVVCDVVIDSGNIDEKEIKKIVRNFCKEKVENYKIPTKVNVVKNLSFSERFKKKRL